MQIQVENDPVVERAEYPLRVASYEANIPGQYGTMIRVHAVITEGKFANVRLTKQFSQRVTPLTDLYKFLKVLDVPVPDQVGAGVELDHMIGKFFIGTGEPSVSSKGNTYNNFKEFRRWVQQYTPPPVSTMAPPVAPPTTPVAPPPATYPGAGQPPTAAPQTMPPQTVPAGAPKVNF